MPMRIAIWGAGGHALVIRDIVLACSHTVLGFLVDSPNRGAVKPFLLSKTTVCPDPLSELGHLNPDAVAVAIGDCKTRMRISQKLRAHGFNLATLVHPSAVIASDSNLGTGTVIAANAVVNSFALIGDDVIINTAATVDHECVVEDGVHIGPGAHLGGNVKVGKGSWIGIGAVVINDVKIGSNTIVGAGAVVTRDIAANSIAYGVPAKWIRENDCGELAHRD